jgi:hypothetical protein
LTKIRLTAKYSVVFRQGAKWLLVVTLTLSLGCHWAILQSAAWVGMVVKYSEEGSFKEAVEKTFDGKHPCKLCKLVREAKDSEKKSEAQVDLKKLDFFTTTKTTFHFTKVTGPALSLNVNFSSRFEPPPIPPPLAA